MLDQQFKARRIHLHARQDTDGQVHHRHLVLIAVFEDQRKMAGEREEKVVVVRGQVGEFINENLWDFGWFGAAGARNTVLCLFWEQLIREFSEPLLQEGTDNVDVVEIAFLEEVDVEFCNSISNDLINATA